MQGFMFALLVCSVTMSLLAFLYMAVTPFLAKRYSAKGRYYAWLIIVVGLIIPFRPQFNNALVLIEIPSVAAISTGRDVRLDVSGGPVLPPSAVIPASPAPPRAAASVSWWHVGFAVWVSGLMAFLIFHAARHYRFVKMVKRWRKSVTDERLTLLLSLKTEMGITKGISLYECDIDSPLLFGLINPCILLPKAALDAEALRFILTHELVHFKRKDLYYKGLVLIATAMHWFNPLVYLMAKAIGAQCERSCDDEVVRGTDADKRQQYSEAIIGVIKYHTKLKPALSTNFYGGTKGMKKRISSIMDTSKKKKGIFIACVIFLAATVVGSMLVVQAQRNNADMHAPLHPIRFEGLGFTDIADLTDALNGIGLTFMQIYPAPHIVPLSPVIPIRLETEADMDVLLEMVRLVGQDFPGFHFAGFTWDAYVSEALESSNAYHY